MRKIGQLVRILGRLLKPLLKTDLSLVKNVLKPLAKSVLIPLGSTAAATAANDPAIYRVAHKNAPYFSLPITFTKIRKTSTFFLPSY